MTAEPEPGWVRRPILAVCTRLAYVLVPLVVSVAAAATLTRSSVVGTLPLLVRLAIVLIVTSLVLVGVHRSLHRLLPLAALLELSVAFPGAAPSRFAVARDAGNTSKLRDIVDRAQRGEVVIAVDQLDAARDVLALVAALRSHDVRTRGHSERVRVFTDLIAEQLHLPAEDRERLRWAALLHDVGKISVPAAVLNKPGSLDEGEWQVVREHPAAGARLTAPLADWLGEWSTTVMEHHEKFDGSGYPAGLRASQISLGGRILAVADSFEVMTAARSYRKPLTREKALRELNHCAGTHFDPKVVRALLAVSAPRLRLAMGPLAWLSASPFALAPAGATIVLQASAVVIASPLAVGAASGGVPVRSVVTSVAVPPTRVVVPPVAQTETGRAPSPPKVPSSPTARPTSSPTPTVPAATSKKPAAQPTKVTPKKVEKVEKTKKTKKVKPQTGNG